MLSLDSLPQDNQLRFISVGSQPERDCLACGHRLGKSSFVNSVSVNDKIIGYIHCGTVPFFHKMTPRAAQSLLENRNWYGVLAGCKWDVRTVGDLSTRRKNHGLPVQIPADPETPTAQVPRNRPYNGGAAAASRSPGIEKKWPENSKSAHDAEAEKTTLGYQATEEALITGRARVARKQCCRLASATVALAVFAVLVALRFR